MFNETTKKLSLNDMFKEEEKLRKRAQKINKLSNSIMIIVSSRIKQRKK